MQLHNNKAALVDAEAALVEDPCDLESNITAGQATSAMGQFMDAFHYYKAGLQIDPNSKVVRTSLTDQMTAHEKTRLN